MKVFALFSVDQDDQDQDGVTKQSCIMLRKFSGYHKRITVNRELA